MEMDKLEYLQGESRTEPAGAICRAIFGQSLTDLQKLNMIVEGFYVLKGQIHVKKTCQIHMALIGAYYLNLEQGWKCERSDFINTSEAIEYFKTISFKREVSKSSIHHHCYSKEQPPAEEQKSNLVNKGFTIKKKAKA